jgi:hypothetical protein
LNEEDRKTTSPNPSSGSRDLEILTYIRPAKKFKGRPAKVRLYAFEVRVFANDKFAGAIRPAREYC